MRRSVLLELLVPVLQLLDQPGELAHVVLQPVEPHDQVGGRHLRLHDGASVARRGVAAVAISGRRPNRRLKKPEVSRSNKSSRSLTAPGEVGARLGVRGGEAGKQERGRRESSKQADCHS